MVAFETLKRSWKRVKVRIKIFPWTLSQVIQKGLADTIYNANEILWVTFYREYIIQLLFSVQVY